MGIEPLAPQTWSLSLKIREMSTWPAWEVKSLGYVTKLIYYAALKAFKWKSWESSPKKASEQAMTRAAKLRVPQGRLSEEPCKRCQM